MPADPAVGQRIMRRRQALDMSQEELALAVGVTRSTVSNWEVGRHFPKKYFGKVEAVLGISLDTPDEPLISPEVQEILDGLSPEQRGYVMERLREADGHLRGRAGGAPKSPAQPHRRAG